MNAKSSGPARDPRNFTAEPAAEGPSSNRSEVKRRQRRELFDRLRGIPDREKAVASEEIRKILAGRPEFQNAALVAAFVSLPSEPDLERMIENGFSTRRWCLPRVTDEGLIEMREVFRFEDLVTGAFGIREPDPTACPLVHEREIDLILLPGVGFDLENRARLGRGKGHYDRFLRRLREMEAPPRVWGICFSEQRTSIDPESHDQPVDAVVTELGFPL